MRWASSSDSLIAHPPPSQRIEAIGARAHWAAERAVGAPIPTPEFDSEIIAIRPKLVGLAHWHEVPPIRSPQIEEARRY